MRRASPPATQASSGPPSPLSAGPRSGAPASGLRRATTRPCATTSSTASDGAPRARPQQRDRASACAKLETPPIALARSASASPRQGANRQTAELPFFLAHHGDLLIGLFTRLERQWSNLHPGRLGRAHIDDLALLARRVLNDVIFRRQRRRAQRGHDGGRQAKFLIIAISSSWPFSHAQLTPPSSLPFPEQAKRNSRPDAALASPPAANTPRRRAARLFAETDGIPLDHLRRTRGGRARWQLRILASHNGGIWQVKHFAVAAGATRLQIAGPQRHLRRCLWRAGEHLTPDGGNAVGLLARLL